MSKKEIVSAKRDEVSEEPGRGPTGYSQEVKGPRVLLGSSLVYEVVPVSLKSDPCLSPGLFPSQREGDPLLYHSCYLNHLEPL